MKKITMKKLYKILLLATISLFAFTSINAQVTNGLILHYSFDGANSLDLVGTNHGVINAAISCPDRFGNPDMAFNFATTFISSGPLTLGNLSQVSVSVWLKPDAATFTSGISSLVHTNHWAVYMNRYTSTGTLLGMLDGSTLDNSANNESSQLSTSNWIHFVMTNNGNTTTIYIDGQLDNSYPENLSWNDGVTLYLGTQYSNGFTHYYNGKLDDFRIYNRALSGLEVDSLYTMPNPVGIVEHNAPKQFNVSPNPVVESFKISNNKKISSVEIVNVLGDIVLVKSVQNNPISGLSSLPEGIYIVRMYNKEEYIGFSKIIKTQD